MEEEAQKKNKIFRFAELAVKKTRLGLSEEELGEMQMISQDLNMSPEDILKAVADNLGLK